MAFRGALHAKTLPIGMRTSAPFSFPWKTNDFAPPADARTARPGAAVSHRNAGRDGLAMDMGYFLSSCFRRVRFGALFRGAH
jgi:hypothetical protein